MTILNKILVMVLGSLLVSSLGGCGECTPKLGNYQVKVTLSDQVPATLAPIQVDVIGMTSDEVEQLRSYSVDKYFSLNDTYRGTWIRNSGRTKSKVLNPGGSRGDNTMEISLARGSGTYEQWAKENVLYLVVMADLKQFSLSNDASMGRGILSLDKCDWGTQKQPLVVTIEQGRVAVPQPPEKK